MAEIKNKGNIVAESIPTAPPEARASVSRGYFDLYSRANLPKSIATADGASFTEAKLQSVLDQVALKIYGYGSIHDQDAFARVKAATFDRLNIRESEKQTSTYVGGIVKTLRDDPNFEMPQQSRDR